MSRQRLHSFRWASLLFVVAVGTAETARGGSVSVLYQSFGSSGISAINLTNPPTGLAGLGDSASYLAYGGGNLYFSSGNTVYWTSQNLTGLNTFRSFGGPITGLAVDAADHILYLSGGGEVAAISLTNPNVGYGALNINASNLDFSGGSLYFSSGNTIYSSSKYLSGLNTVKSFGGLVTGLAVDAADHILYVAGGGEAASISLTNPNLGYGALNINASNLVAGDGMVYIQSGDTIYSSSKYLQGLNTVLTSNSLPVDLALFSAPEPSTCTLVLAGLPMLLGLARRLRRRKP